MVVTIREIRFQRIHKKLKKTFVTSLQTVNDREAIMVTIISDNGLEGFGECVAFSTPWYTEETVESCAFVMERVLKPLLQGRILSSPHEVATVFAPVKGNHMAKAAIEIAVWDLFAKYEGVPLWQYIGGIHKHIPAGVVVAAGADGLLHDIEQAVSKGYSRIKIKITAESDIDLLKEAISRYPDIMFFADANGGFNKDSFGQLTLFDDVGFSLMEQPFGKQEWDLHAQAKKQMKTPICLDESITSIHDVERMIEMQAADIIVLKMGRLGGWHETLKVVDLCRRNSIGMWVGGMIEFGISKAHNLALASLPDIVLPGDFSDSRHFWNEDVITPEIEVIDGKIELQQQAGIGYSVDLNKARL
ncbi:o-succinylbenzoate synthase [Planococcus halotolerans]|uniref:o-succinylbenzoate synthase n=1 Tax=Planococcus halotolerans TaxID=2233542 RepID=A0A365KLI1_9BACL|nr:o-succinylbenzoate synthase [Planococcus halotolerans]QHJ71774.1 o-succinylbenzoate synthase [Planococcus halotolerans]RAZ74011.1 o-succinylbenzoate synthase [Planococcus halotolerans]